ncbi:MAG: hypothetical protein EBR09_11060 [Proteobacteria bacterium]|nr:hypothetical protein [Pseudomonadota bacterium]
MNTSLKILTAVVFSLPAAIASGFEIGGGGGFVTQGDDRLSPATYAWMQTERILVSASAMGEKNSSYSQQIIFPVAGYVVYPAKSKSVQASVGLGGMISYTRLANSEEKNAALQKLQRTAGLAFGLRWSPKISRNLIFRAAWDSVFIPPGLSVMYLTFGHMQSVTAGLGWEF